MDKYELAVIIESVLAQSRRDSGPGRSVSHTDMATNLLYDLKQKGFEIKKRTTIQREIVIARRIQ